MTKIHMYPDAMDIAKLAMNIIVSPSKGQEGSESCILTPLYG